jgi:hypothetical protein
MPTRFSVAMSFPGEHRALIEAVANALADQLTPEKVFYDRYYEHELARPNLDIYLQQIYHDDAELVVTFLCQKYSEKDWCGLEWRAIRDLIKKRRDSHEINVTAKAWMPSNLSGTSSPLTHQDRGRRRDQLDGVS